MMKTLMRFLIALAMVSLIAACGGGGGCAGTPTNGTNTCTSSSTAATTTTQTAAAMTLTFTNSTVTFAALPAPTTVTSTPNTYVVATVLDSSGAVVPNQIVNFSTDATIGLLSASMGLTDSSGRAWVRIQPASLTASGAAIVSATSTMGSQTVNATAGYMVGASNVGWGAAMTVNPASVTALGTASVTVPVLVNGSPATAGQVNVTLTPSCGYFTSTSTPAISVPTDASGNATATWYSQSSCGGQNVSLTATATGATAPLTGTVAVQAAQPANVLFNAATVTTLVVSSATSGQKQSTVSFKVVDSSNNPMPNWPVTITLDNQSINAGVKFNLSGTLTTAAQTMNSGSNGLASVTIQSGTIPTPVVVTGAITVSGATLSATSSGIVVTAGKPAQSATSLSATKLNIEGLYVDGVTTNLTLRTSDRNGNPVPVGTAVTFIASHGTVTGSCLTDATSSCQVTYTTSGTRPADGVVTILAYLDGEESFVDANGNNVYDTGESFSDMGQAYLDVNHNGTYDSGDQAIGTATAGATAACPVGAYPSIANTCDGVWSSSIRVRQPILIGVSSSTASIAVTASAPPNKITVFVKDSNSSVGMATGTTVAAAVTTAGIACSVTNVSPSPFPNQVYGQAFDVFLNQDATCTAGVKIDFTVTTPANVKTVARLTL